MNEEKRPELKIKKMPDKKTLEEFLKGMHGVQPRVSVIFNSETGKFERLPEAAQNLPAR